MNEEKISRRAKQRPNLGKQRRLRAVSLLSPGTAGRQGENF